MKFRSGALIGQLSGSLGSVTASHNRYGSYVRGRSIPVNVGSEYQEDQKGVFATASALWKAQGVAVRNQWFTWARNNPVTDKLGEARTLDGHAAFTMLNARLIAASAAPITAPPIGASPAGLETMTFTADIGAGTFGAAYTATPLAAGNKLVIRAAVVNSQGIVFVRNQLKLVAYSAAAQASPFDFQVPLELRFGSLIVGQWVHVYVAVMSTTTGLLSAPLIDNAVVVSTV